MSRIMETKVYTFDELSDEAKERARDWFRQGNCEDTFWSEFIFEDAKTIAEILGIEFKTRPVKLMGGGTRHESCIYWSGFWSQGDGASYEGRYSYAKGASKKIREYAPKDERLHSIADQLEALQRKRFYSVEIGISQSGNYLHEMTMRFDASHKRTGDELGYDVEQDFAEPLRDFARWIYRQLESEYEYRQSDETVDEDIRANEYEFTEDGRRSVTI